MKKCLESYQVIWLRDVIIYLLQVIIFVNGCSCCSKKYKHNLFLNFGSVNVNVHPCNLQFACLVPRTLQDEPALPRPLGFLRLWSRTYGNCSFTLSHCQPVPRRWRLIRYSFLQSLSCSFPISSFKRRQTRNQYCPDLGPMQLISTSRFRRSKPIHLIKKNIVRNLDLMKVQ